MVGVSKNVKIGIYRTIILPPFLYEFEAWSLTLREECRLNVIENKVLRRILGPDRDEVTGSYIVSSLMICLTKSYSSDQIKNNELPGTCGT